MKTFILYNDTIYPYHSDVLTLIISFFNINKIPYSTFHTSNLSSFNVLQSIDKEKPDVIITFDLAGFSYRTQLGEISLNNLFTKNLNLIWGSKPEYTKYLSKKLSLSMHFYDVTGIDHKLRNQYPNIEYYNANYTLEDINDFSNLWENFINEVLLTE